MHGQAQWEDFKLRISDPGKDNGECEILMISATHQRIQETVGTKGEEATSRRSLEGASDDELCFVCLQHVLFCGRYQMPFAECPSKVRTCATKAFSFGRVLELKIL